jgi:hypothetical protein
MDAPFLRMEEPLDFGGEIVSDGHDENASDRFVFWIRIADIPHGPKHR